MSRKQQYTAKQVAEAMANNRGIIAAAARELGCTRRTVQNYRDRYETVRQACTEARETFVDHLEYRFLERVNAGDTKAIIFGLRALGKDRGWTETYHHELTGKNTGPIEMATELVVGFDDELSDEEFEELEREHQRMRVEARSRADALRNGEARERSDR